MPFKECSLMDQRSEFCRLASGPGANMRELCRRFKVSPTTGYKWLRRHGDGGAAGLADRSHRPHTSPSRTDTATELAILGVREAHPAWGGRKIRRVLQDDGLCAAPAASTITEILRRRGRLDGPGTGQQRSWTRFEHAAPNDLWQMDFKGHVAMADGRRCHPLTILDDHSRYALEVGACANEQGSTVRGRLERVFQRYGLPWRLLTDNGPPWGVPNGLARHTALTVWLLDLGVETIHGRPHHPQTQGKDERFHRSLNAEALDGPPFADLDRAQEVFDRWRHVYNERRPHEAIGLNTPASRYAMSRRPMPERIEPPCYEPQAQVRKVDSTARISFKGRAIDVSRAFVGRQLALRATETNGVFDLCYRRHVLSQVDLRENVVKPVHHQPEQASTLCPA
jgi:transposase InsO family protein